MVHARHLAPRPPGLRHHQGPGGEAEQALGRPLPRHHGQHDRHRGGGPVLEPGLPLHLLAAHQVWSRGLSGLRARQGRLCN